MLRWLMQPEQTADRTIYAKKPSFGMAFLILVTQCATVRPRSWPFQEGSYKENLSS
jgi:hypothetical protein